MHVQSRVRIHVLCGDDDKPHAIRAHWKFGGDGIPDVGPMADLGAKQDLVVGGGVPEDDVRFQGEDVYEFGLEHVGEHPGIDAIVGRETRGVVNPDGRGDE